MRFEIPEFARCCICVPLRHGILTFGYLNLGFTGFLVAIELYVTLVYDSESSVGEVLQSTSTYMYRGVGFYAQMWFIVILYGCEILFNLILLIGAHMKNPKLIRLYYYFGITTSLAAFLCYLLLSNDPSYWRPFDHHVVEFCFAFAGSLLQVYLLLLIRSELRKLEMEGHQCFVNHTADVFVEPPPYNHGRNPV